jgi:hypothetical protein
MTAKILVAFGTPLSVLILATFVGALLAPLDLSARRRPFACDGHVGAPNADHTARDHPGPCVRRVARAT